MNVLTYLIYVRKYVLSGLTVHEYLSVYKLMCKVTVAEVFLIYVHVLVEVKDGE